MMSLTNARSLATAYIRRAQKKFKDQHDKRVHTTECQVGDWILICFPHEESGAKQEACPALAWSNTEYLHLMDPILQLPKCTSQRRSQFMFTAAGFSLHLLASQLAITTMEPISMALDITLDGLMLCTVRMIKCMESRGTTCVHRTSKISLLGSSFPERGGDVKE